MTLLPPSSAPLDNFFCSKNLAQLKPLSDADDVRLHDAHACTMSLPWFVTKVATGGDSGLAGGSGSTEGQSDRTSSSRLSSPKILRRRHILQEQSSEHFFPTTGCTIERKIDL